MIIKRPKLVTEAHWPGMLKFWKLLTGLVSVVMGACVVFITYFAIKWGVAPHKNISTKDDVIAIVVVIIGTWIVYSPWIVSFVLVSRTRRALAAESLARGQNPSP